MIAKVYCSYPDDKPDIIECDIWEIEGQVIIFKTFNPLKTILYPLDSVIKIVMTNKDLEDVE